MDKLTRYTVYWHSGEIDSCEDGEWCKEEKVAILEEKLAELQRENEWISVEDRLPDTLGEHLVLVAPLAGCGFYAAAWYHDGLWEVRGENGNARDLITHWKPIQPPTEEG